MTTRRGTVALALAVVTSAWASDTAHGQPWHENVVAADKQAARALFEIGNTLRDEGQLEAAVDRYLAATRIWDHPAIHANLGIVQMRMDRPLEAHRSLTAAMRFRGAGLTRAVRENVRAQLTALRRRLAELVVDCSTGSRIELDGQSICAERADDRRMLTAGNHLLVARAPGRAGVIRELALLPGEQTRVSIELAPTRRWSRWKPWAVTLGGAVSLVGSVALALAAERDFRAYRAQAEPCEASGCAPERTVELRAFRDRGMRLRTGAYAMLVVGGGATAAGAALLILNRARRERTLMRHDRRGLTVKPIVGVGPKGATLQVSAQTSF